MHVYSSDDKNKASKEYRQTLNKNYRKFYRDLNKKLRVLKSNNSKEYWRILNETKGNDKIATSNVAMEAFVEH